MLSSVRCGFALGSAIVGFLLATGYVRVAAQDAAASDAETSAAKRDGLAGTAGQRPFRESRLRAAQPRPNGRAPGNGVRPREASSGPHAVSGHVVAAMHRVRQPSHYIAPGLGACGAAHRGARSAGRVRTGTAPSECVRLVSAWHDRYLRDTATGNRYQDMNRHGHGRLQRS